MIPWGCLNIKNWGEGTKGAFGSLKKICGKNGASQVAAPHMMELLYHHGPSLSALPYDEALAGAVLGS